MVPVTTLALTCRPHPVICTGHTLTSPSPPLSLSLSSSSSSSSSSSAFTTTGHSGVCSVPWAGRHADPAVRSNRDGEGRPRGGGQSAGGPACGCHHHEGDPGQQPLLCSSPVDVVGSVDQCSHTHTHTHARSTLSRTLSAHPSLGRDSCTAPTPRIHALPPHHRGFINCPHTTEDSCTAPTPPRILSG
jgi:hypothetical protein